MRNALMWFYYSWDSIMNVKYNPLSYVRNVSMQMYFMTALSILWTATFCGLIAGWTNVIPLIYGHIGFLFATFMTYGVFKDAERDRPKWFEKWNTDYLADRAFKNRDKTKNACRWNLEIEA
ncbi:MAG: hypothetical protein CMN34_05840 [Saprospirales bacterium]|nr:hypothetical protein [Saprospirales bacterium]|tara:strand:- start:3041 stop:3403 length:363 start_codon:yes stop_codon:yes gene_type:complete